MLLQPGDPLGLLSKESRVLHGVGVGHIVLAAFDPPHRLLDSRRRPPQRLLGLGVPSHSQQLLGVVCQEVAQISMVVRAAREFCRRLKSPPDLRNGDDDEDA